MTKKNIQVHKFIIAVILSILAWQVTNAWIIEIPIWKFFFIEILIALFEEFSTFITKKAGQASQSDKSDFLQKNPWED